MYFVFTPYMLLVLLIVYVILSKNDSRSNLYPKAVAKVITFYTYFLILLKLFLKFFSRKVFVGRLLTANCKESLLGSIIFTPFPLSICQLLRLLPCGSGCKSTLFIRTLQIFLPLFLSISLECYRIVTQVTYTLLFKRQNFFSFFRFFFYLFVFLFSDIA